MCMIIILGLLGPRIAAIIWWLADSARWTLAFGDNYLLPALGIAFLPWTTIVYILCFPEGIAGLDLMWLIVAVIVDMGSYLGGGVGSRNRSNFKAVQ